MSRVGLSEQGPKVVTPLQGKIVHGGSFNGNEEEGKKEETLTLQRGKLANTQIFHWPLERSTS
jgi:hypothetical protein